MTATRPERVLGQTQRVDALTAGILAIAATLVSIVVSRRGGLPQEDAAILFRYSENVANGFGIVYNPGGPRVDGATDMPFMGLIAALYRLGFSVVDGAAVVNALAAGLMFGLIYFTWLRWANVGRFWSLGPIVLLVAGPLWQYGMAGFGTVFFAATVTTVAFASEAAARRPTTFRLVALGATVAACGLARPEGFLLGGAIVLAQSIRMRSWRMLLLPFAIVVPVGVLWVAWRWTYFGYPLPNPFYKKGGGQLYSSGLQTSLENTARLAVPFLVIPFVGLWLQHTRRLAVAIFGVTTFWATLWILLSDEMNFQGRFQFAIVPVIAILSATIVRPVVAAVIPRPPVIRRSLTGALVAALSLTLIAMAWDYGRPTRWQFSNAPSNVDDNIHAAVASVLQNASSSKPRKLASSEAGYVAWKSGWQVTDLWGLNDKRIAHEGYMQPDDLQEFRPAVIFSHICASNGTSPDIPNERPCIANWEQMSDPLLCFVDQHDYDLAGLWVDSPNHSWAVWVDPKASDHADLREAFATMPAGREQNNNTLRVNSASEGSLATPRNCASLNQAN